MAGFNENQSGNPVFQRIRDSVKSLSNFGMRYGDMVIKNSQAIGAIEAEFMKKQTIDDENLLYSLGRQDTTTRQFIGYFDKDYPGKRDYLRKFALNPEIEYILDTVCDESITYDSYNFFAYPAFLNLTDVKDKVKDRINENYKKLYEMFGFTDDVSGWQYFKQLLVDGFIAFEIVYDDKGKNIIGFKELDATTLMPSVEKQPDGTYLSVWWQYPKDINKKRMLYDSQVIYISYAKGNTVSRVSYTERLIRPYNILRIIEYTRVIWSVMNASFRMKMTVPIGSRSPQKAMQTLGELMSIYKEDIRFNDESGELTVDGRPKIQFYKNYLMPSGVNGTPTIEPLNTAGPNLNDPAPLAYFFDKLVQESKIPFSRFQGPDGGSIGNYSNGAEGLDKEEIRFAKFINRLRSIFQDILVKPLWIQTVKDFPELEKDYLFKSQLGLNFVSDNPFRMNQEIETMTAKKTQIESMYALTDDTGAPYFSLAYLIENYLGMTQDDIKANKEARKKRSEEEKKKAKEAAAAAPAAEAPAEEAPAEAPAEEAPAETPPPTE
jgi:hypothetical protein